MKVLQLVRPIRGAQQPFDQWAVSVAPFELGRLAKTGLMDESVLLDCPKWAHRYLAKLVRGRRPQNDLWDFDLRRLAELFALGIRANRLEHLGATLYANRHGGASEDYLRSRRTLAEIQSRGRWRSPASVRRYTKAAKLMAELNKVGPMVISLGEHLLKHMGAFFAEPTQTPNLDEWIRGRKSTSRMLQ